MARHFDPRSTCLHLRCKEMYYEEPQQGPDAGDDTGSGLPDPTPYWCECTQTGRGPDAKPVSRALCCPGRSCFVNVASLT